MAYAGTYGPDETCTHDGYWRSCAVHGPTGPDPWPTSEDNPDNRNGVGGFQPMSEEWQSCGGERRARPQDDGSGSDG